MSHLFIHFRFADDFRHVFSINQHQRLACSIVIDAVRTQFGADEKQCNVHQFMENALLSSIIRYVIVYHFRFFWTITVKFAVIFHLLGAFPGHSLSHSFSSDCVGLAAVNSQINQHHQSKRSKISIREYYVKFSSSYRLFLHGRSSSPIALWWLDPPTA